jgi:hypothetical protein
MNSCGMITAATTAVQADTLPVIAQTYAHTPRNCLPAAHPAHKSAATQHYAKQSLISTVHTTRNSFTSYSLHIGPPLLILELCADCIPLATVCQQHAMPCQARPRLVYAPKQQSSLAAVVECESGGSSGLSCSHRHHSHTVLTVANRPVASHLLKSSTG